MALIIDFEGNAQLISGQSVEIVPARMDRRGIMIQLQCAGAIWMKFGGHAAVDDGLLLEAGEIFQFPNGAPNELTPGNDYYEGPIYAYYDCPSMDVLDGPEACVVRVVEIS